MNKVVRELVFTLWTEFKGFCIEFLFAGIAPSSESFIGSNGRSTDTFHPFGIGKFTIDKPWSPATAQNTLGKVIFVLGYHLFMSTPSHFSFVKIFSVVKCCCEHSIHLRTAYWFSNPMC